MDLDLAKLFSSSTKSSTVACLLARIANGECRKHREKLRVPKHRISLQYRQQLLSGVDRVLEKKGHSLWHPSTVSFKLIAYVELAKSGLGFSLCSVKSLLNDDSALLMSSWLLLIASGLVTRRLQLKYGLNSDTVLLRMSLSCSDTTSWSVFPSQRGEVEPNRVAQVS